MAQYKVIAGTFHVKGFSPDGDSIRFQAKDQSHWEFFTWKGDAAAKKDDKRKQLRVESIDALETHYEGYHQPRTDRRRDHGLKQFAHRKFAQL